MFTPSLIVICRVSIKKGIHIFGNVGYLDDDDVLLHIDDAILSASPHLGSLMSVLFERGFRPSGQMPTLIFATSFFTNSYEAIRMDGGEPKESIDLAISLTINHPVIQKFIAKQMSVMIDTAAEVQNE